MVSANSPMPVRIGDDSDSPTDTSPYLRLVPVLFAEHKQTDPQDSLLHPLITPNQTTLQHQIHSPYLPESLQVSHLCQNLSAFQRKSLAGKETSQLDAHLKIPAAHLPF
ncbi:hypothetical protein NE237_004724 [Protea cynaroides]|uniref:Uncharacterized protein n=1 Tax=Protea cynaroides TaxID=273540 RepID=A0A9Q0QTU8_9MAGN|nr:hypothetical protein NE237_004724 [Protea cynaroides]